MFHKITEKTFYQFLKCPNWVYFDLHADRARPHHPLMEQLIDDGLIDAKQREIISDRTDVAEVTAEDPDEAFLQTLAFMREGRQTIYHGVLIDQHWVGHPDILERVEGQSNFGNYYYIAADLKRSRYLRDEFKFQGCFYAELLECVQGVRPVNGYTLSPDRETFSFSIEEFEAQFHLTLTEIEKIIAGNKPAHFVTSGCRQSPWFQDCKRESESCDDISLLNRVWREEVAALEHVGVKTISDLASLSLSELERRVPNVSVTRLEIMHDQALAIKHGTHMIRASIDLPDHGIELYFDIESDPLRDFDYLFGVLTVSKDGESYHPFMAESPAQEANMWVEFCDFIAQHLDAPVYHYGAFEQEVVRRFSAKYGVSPIVAEAIERNMIDLLELVRPAVIFPLSFYSLKDIASYIGFHWRAEDASGANSVLWFEEWLDSKKPAYLQKILEYNEDDVMATWELKKWLRKNGK
jgi:uncharacterized protein